MKATNRFDSPLLVSVLSSSNQGASVVAFNLCPGSSHMRGKVLVICLSVFLCEKAIGGLFSCWPPTQHRYVHLPESAIQYCTVNAVDHGIIRVLVIVLELEELLIVHSKR